MGDLILPFRQKKVLITGGGGYLGSELAAKLKETASEILLVDRKFNSVSQQLARQYDTIKPAAADLLNPAGIAELCQQFSPDYIFHFGELLARNLDFSVYQDLHAVNVQGTLNLLQAVKEIDYTAFLYSSSAEVYGQNPLPFSEDQIPDPASPYSLTKLFGEELIRTHAAIHQKNYIIFRIFNFYGPGMPDNTFIPQLLKARDQKEIFVMSKGEQKRDYLVTEDLLTYLTGLAGMPQAYGHTINLCSGESVSMADIADYIQRKSDPGFEIARTMPYRANEIWEIRGSAEKLRTFIPEITSKSIFEGL